MNIHKIIKDIVERDGPAIYRHLGYEQDHLRKIMALEKEGEVEFLNTLYLPERNEAGEIIRYVAEDTQKYIGDLKRNHKNKHTHADRLRNMTFKNVFFFGDDVDVFKHAKTNDLPFLIITYVSKRLE